MKISIAWGICIFVLAIPVVFSVTSTTDGMTVEYVINTQTSAPDKTLYEVANQQNNYINKKTNLVAKTVTYTGELHSDYPFNSYFTIYNKSGMTEVRCSTTYSNNNCVLTYTTTPPDDSELVYVFFNEFGGMSNGQLTFNAAGLGEVEKTTDGMMVSMQISTQTSTPDPTLYGALNNYGNYMNRFTDTGASTVTFVGEINSVYPFNTYFSIYNKSSSLTERWCSSTFGSNQCSFSYSATPPDNSDLVYVYYNQFGGVSNGFTSFNAGGTGEIELITDGMRVNMQLYFEEIVPPSYISPTPANGARKYNLASLIIKLNDTSGASEDCYVEIDGTNDSMTETSDVYNYTYSIGEISSVQTITFQAFCNSTGVVTPLTARTVYIYPEKSSSGGDYPFYSPIALVIGLFGLFVYLRGGTWK